MYFMYFYVIHVGHAHSFPNCMEMPFFRHLRRLLGIRLASITKKDWADSQCEDHSPLWASGSPNSLGLRQLHELRTVGKMFLDTVAKYPAHPALRYKEGREWKTITYSEYYNLSITVAKAFLKVSWNFTLPKGCSSTLRPGSCHELQGKMNHFIDMNAKGL